MSRLAVSMGVVLVLACGGDESAKRNFVSQAAAPGSNAADTAKNIPEESWSPTEIVPGRDLKRAVMYRNGWDPGNEALLLPQAEATRLYTLLAGNQQLQYMCGYHWSITFEFTDGTIQTQPLNQECERFRTDHDDIWRLLKDLWARAAERPTHRTFRADLRQSGDIVAATGELRARGYIVLEHLEWPGGRALVVASDAAAGEDVVAHLHRASTHIAAVETFNRTGYAGKQAG